MKRSQWVQERDTKRHSRTGEGRLRIFLLASICGTATGGLAQGGSPSEDATGRDLPTLPISCAITQEGTNACVSGEVLDTVGHPQAGATVISLYKGRRLQSVIADESGRFCLEVPRGMVELIVTAPGFTPEIVHVDATKEATQRMEPIVMRVASVSEQIEVVATREQVAQAQVQMEEKQRFLGVFPNFYTSYMWDAEPLSRKQKFSLATRSIFDPITLLGVGALAGADQLRGSFPGYGGGLRGYAARAAADFGDQVSARYLGSAILPALFKADPRYFYKGSGSIHSRSAYAVSRTFVTRDDRGRSRPNYSRVLGAVLAGSLSNAYRPPDDRGFQLTLRNAGIAIGGNAVDNLLREFLFKRYTPNLPPYASGRSPAE